MNQNQTDPWNFPEHIPSPDGRFAVRYHGFTEIGMGGPLSGFIELEPLGYRPAGYESFGGPAVWSEDSRYVTVPRWRGVPRQRLFVFDVEQMVKGVFSQMFRIVNITYLGKGEIKGVESPLFVPREFSVSLRDLQWRPIHEDV